MKLIEFKFIMRVLLWIERVIILTSASKIPVPNGTVKNLNLIEKDYVEYISSVKANDRA